MPESEQSAVLRGPDVIDALDQARRLGCSLRIKTAGMPGPCESRVLNVSQTEKLLEISTVQPREINAVIRPGKAIELSMNFGRYLYTFTSACASVKSDTTRHRLNLPVMIQRIQCREEAPKPRRKPPPRDSQDPEQRRAYFRISLPSDRLAAASIRYNAADPFTRIKIVNLSVGGALLEETRFIHPPFTGYELGLQLQFADGSEHALQGLVRHVSRAPAGGLRMGVEFESADHAARQALTQAVMAWQLHARRDEVERAAD